MGIRINSQAALESACFTAFGFFLFYLVGSKRYLNYVTPRMVPYLCFTAIVLLAWAGFRLRELFRPQHRNRAAHCLILIIPTLLLLLPLGAISSSSGYGSTLSGISGSGQTAFSGTAASTGASASSGTSSGTNGTAAASSQTDAVKQSSLSLAKDGSIQVSDDQFYAWLSEIYTNMDKYDGKTITIKGFVYRDSSAMQSNQFVPARMLMYCCAADLVPCGMLCEYDKVSELQAGDWVTVTGTIQIQKEQGEQQPVISVRQVISAHPPSEEYVYPW